MSTSDEQPQTVAVKVFDIAMGACAVLFVFGMGSGAVYGFWNWLLSSPCVR
ncbi:MULTISPECIES: hypothetical protein [Variovorax]|uniref:hypothetical protein n=1 Tax=Variovorax TaxID=34072 RepID=UPI0034E8C98B